MNRILNVLLDGFPTQYKGYKINTDFRRGILITLLQEDESIDEDLKLLQALNLLYAEKVPDDLDVATKGLMWFLSCGKSELYFEEDEDNDDSPDKALDFTQDHLDIWSAFYKLGVDLEKDNLHWFKFLSLLGSIGDCALAQKIQFRTTDLTKMKGDTRKYYLKLKNKYKVRKVITKEEHEAKMKEMEQNYGSYYMKLMALNKKV